MAFFIGDNCWVDHPLTTLMINFKERFMIILKRFLMRPGNVNQKLLHI